MKRRTFLATACAAFAVGCAGKNAGDAEVLAWGGPGRRPGSFVHPRAINVSDGEVFVVDKTGRIQVFDRDGEYLRHWSTPSADNGTPTCIAFSADKSVYVPDTHYSTIMRYDRDGVLLEQWGSYGLDDDQFIYPTGIIETADGHTFICEYGVDAECVKVFDKDRKFVVKWGSFGTEPGQFNRAMAIDMDAQQRLYVCETGNNRVQVFDLDGNVLSVLGEIGVEEGQLKDPFDLSVAPDGRVFVIEYGTDRVSLFNDDGFVRSYGNAGRELGSFHAPRGVALDLQGGFLFVADTENHRVQRLSLAHIGGLA